MTVNSETLHLAPAKSLPINGWGWLPLVALTGGIWAYAPTGETLPYASGLMSLVLILGSWWPWWEALAYTDWGAALGQWRTWETDVSPSLLPYTQAGTPGAVLAQTIGQAHHWWRAAGRDALQSPLRRAGLALLVGLLLAAIRGRTPLLLTLLFITWSELAVLWHGGKGQVGSGWAAFPLVGMPWFLGASLWSGNMRLPAISALILTLLIGCHAHASLLAAGGPLIGAAFLVWQGHPLAAGWLLLLALPGLNLLREQPSSADYQRGILPWLLAMVLSMAGVL